MGAGALRFSGTAPAPPSASTMTSLTALMTCWPGATLSITSMVTARSRTLAMKSFTHRERDVGLQQRQAHLAQGLGDVHLRQAAALAQPVEHPIQLARQSVEHRARSTTQKAPLRDHRGAAVPPEGRGADAPRGRGMGEASGRVKIAQHRRRLYRRIDRPARPFCWDEFTMRRLLFLGLALATLWPLAETARAQATADQLNKLSLEALTAPSRGGGSSRSLPRPGSGVHYAHRPVRSTYRGHRYAAPRVSSRQHHATSHGGYASGRQPTLSGRASPATRRRH